MGINTGEVVTGTEERLATGLARRTDEARAALDTALAMGVAKENALSAERARVALAARSIETRRRGEHERGAAGALCR